MQSLIKSSRRFLIQSILLFLLMAFFSFIGVYISGQTAYRSANEMGAMTADYLNLQINTFMDQYEQILEDAAYMVNAMLEQGAAPDDIEQWVTSFASEYADSMPYDESGIYGIVDGQAIFSSGWEPDESYNIYTRPWYTQAIEKNGECARSTVYQDARNSVSMVSLSQLLSDGSSVLALDIRVGDIEVEWQEGSDIFPGTTTIVDQNGNVVLHQQIGTKHIKCEMDDYTSSDYKSMMEQFDDERGTYKWKGEFDSYYSYYITDSSGWTCIVTIPRSLITHDAATLFYTQLIVLGVIFLIILYLSIQNYKYEKKNRHALNCFEALGRTYFGVVLIDALNGKSEILKFSDILPPEYKKTTSYSTFMNTIEKNICHDHDRQQFKNQFQQSNLLQLHEHKTERIYLEYEQQEPDGPRWISAEAIAVESSNEHPQIILAFRQIHNTKVRELEHSQALRESLEIARTANEAKSDFLSRMSHDMRTPMNAVIGFSELADKHLNQPEKVHDCLQKISAASHQLLHLINEVLDTAKIEQGQMDLNIVPVSLSQHLKSTADFFQFQAQAQQQQFSMDISGLRHDRIMTDGNRLDQVLNNLLSNAVKYTLPGGKISLVAEELPGNKDTQRLFRFVVSDTGIGMSPEFLEKIFLPFEREDTSMTGKTNGVGLGMAITHSILQMMGGRIDVSSQQGVGSSFSVILPCELAGDSSGLKTEDDDSLSSFSLQGYRILLAEDNFLNMEIATELLSMEGAIVTSAINGQEAVDIFESSPPGSFDVILMDIQMPVLNGYQAAEAIRKSSHKDAADIPIFAMTANAFEDDKLQAVKSGMNGHIAKPADINRIKEAISKSLI